ncbi:MAG: orotate phosphoribosyltransferase [Candidatus Omnitrophica bacterium]|nr:orotate phosphoribosyltransferase [Candidatus Omnitrophota bacterium]MCM8798573.1 orotate phosphoribosyltransferase [Candidatus Omnitrophota bacterium]
MNRDEVLDILGKTGAILNGHFILSSGLHSDKYIQCALTLQYPKYSAWLARAIADKFRTEMITVVLSPAVGAIVLGQEVAKAVGARAIFTEREEGKMTLRRGFSLTKNDRVLIVEDVLTTGSTVNELINLVRENEGRLIGVAAIVDRATEKLEFKDRFEYLVKIPIKNYSEDKCPLCKEGVPAVKLGSRGLK